MVEQHGFVNPSGPALEALLTGATRIARDAGRAILRHYAAAEVRITTKSDGSPLTAADDEADAIIRAGLARLAPDIPAVTEECIGTLQPHQLEGLFWMVDPLDGTREFIGRNGEFTVNIALIADRRPVLGVVCAPAIDRLFTGAVGLGAWAEDAAGPRRIACRLPPVDGLTVVASRSHGDAEALERFLAGRVVQSLVHVGSSLKFCLVACAEADLYPRLGRTMEWDTAAGHAVLRAAGGEVCTLDGAPLAYGKPGYANPHFFAHGLAG